jgi:pimeloyl-ACP methyl ester carboxylesterase
MGDESFWTQSLFHAELSNLVSKLSLSSYDVLGQSWGGMMGSTFAGGQPKGLRKLVLSNSPATGEAWDNAYNDYRKELPEEIQDTLEKHENAGTTQSSEYASMMEIFYGKHFCKIIPFPDECQASFDWGAKDNTVTMTM